MSTHPYTQEHTRPSQLPDHGNGLLDIFVGLGVLFAGLSLAVQMPWLTAILPLWLAPACFGARRRLIATRTTELRSSAASQDRTNRLLILLAAVGPLLLAIVAAWGWTLDTLPGWLEAHRAALPAIGLGLPVVLALALTAAVKGIARYYAYAMVAAVLFAAGYLIDWAVWWSVIGVGATVALGGTASLALFFNRQPRTG